MEGDTLVTEGSSENVEESERIGSEVLTEPGSSGDQAGATNNEGEQPLQTADDDDGDSGESVDKNPEIDSAPMEDITAPVDQDEEKSQDVPATAQQEEKKEEVEDVQEKAETEPEPEPEPVETDEERLKRIKEFYDTEFSRADLEPLGSSKVGYTIIRYENYQRPSQHQSSNQSHKKPEINEGNAKIAEYFGEDLNSDDEFDQLMKQMSEANLEEESEGNSGGDKRNGMKQSGKEGKQSFLQQSAVPETILEEKENELNAQSSPAKQKEKSKSEKKKKNYDIASTKVHIRHLPKNMRKEDFLDAIGPLPEYNYLHFTSGQFMSRVCNRRCTGFCHINFINQDDADAFVSSYRLFIIRDDRGEETLGSVEYAINQRVPKNNAFSAAKSLRSLYDMQKDQTFLDFKTNYENTCGGIIGVPVNPDGTITADVMMNEIEEKHQQKSELQTTPLLSYIMAQSKNEKDKKFGSVLKKASEKSRITIKKEKKRDRRDRRDRKEKEKEKKILRSSLDEKGDTKENKQSDKKPKPPRNEKSDKAEQHGGRNHRHHNDSAATTKDSESRPPTASRGESGNKKSSTSSREKGEIENNNNKKDKKNASSSPNKKSEKRQDKRQSSGPTGGRHVKAEGSGGGSGITTDSGRITEEASKAHSFDHSSKNPEPSANAATTDAGDKSQQQAKKKTVKRVVKVKKVIKSKLDESGNPVPVAAEKKENVSSKTVEESHTKTGSKTVGEVSKSESSSGGSKEKDGQAGGNSGGSDSKRTKKARPDIQIYRPGSLRSSKTGAESGKRTESAPNKKEKANSSSAGSGSKEKVTQDDSNRNGS